jgi:Flp pilus assembly protein TadG
LWAGRDARKISAVVERTTGQRGQAIVEMALMVPLLLMIVMGAIDFGRAFFAYTSAANAAREGAVCASLRTSCPIGFLAAVEDEVGDTLEGGVTATMSPNPIGAPGSTVTVTVSHDFTSITTAILSERTFPLRASATMVVQ